LTVSTAPRGLAKAWKLTPGDGEVEYEIGQPRTRRSIRIINLPAAVLDQLDYGRDWLFVITEGGPIRPYFWRTNVRTPSLTKATTKDEQHPDKLLLTRRLRVHDLRHVCASWLLDGGVPLVTASATWVTPPPPHLWASRPRGWAGSRGGNGEITGLKSGLITDHRKLCWPDFEHTIIRQL
jgi:hypothetical protein